MMDQLRTLKPIVIFHIHTSPPFENFRARRRHRISWFFFFYFKSFPSLGTSTRIDVFPGESFAPDLRALNFDRSIRPTTDGRRGFPVCEGIRVRHDCRRTPAIRLFCTDRRTRVRSSRRPVGGEPRSAVVIKITRVSSGATHGPEARVRPDDKREEKEKKLYKFFTVDAMTFNRLTVSFSQKIFSSALFSDFRRFRLANCVLRQQRCRRVTFVWINFQNFTR